VRGGGGWRLQRRGALAAETLTRRVLRPAFGTHLIRCALCWAYGISASFYTGRSRCASLCIGRGRCVLCWTYSVGVSPCTGTGRWGGAGRHPRGNSHAERHRAAHLHPVSRPKPSGVGDALAVDEGADGRAEVFDPHTLRPHNDPGVVARDRPLRQKHVVIRGAADGVSALVEGERLARLGAALDHQAGLWRGLGRRWILRAYSVSASLYVGGAGGDSTWGRVRAQTAGTLLAKPGARAVLRSAIWTSHRLCLL